MLVLLHYFPFLFTIFLAFILKTIFLLPAVLHDWFLPSVFYLLSSVGWWLWWMWIAANRRTRSPDGLAWSKGQQPLGAVLHLSDEPSELSQWLSHDDSTMNIVMSAVLVLLILQYWQLCCYQANNTDTAELLFWRSLRRSSVRTRCTWDEARLVWSILSWQSRMHWQRPTLLRNGTHKIVFSARR